MRKITWAYTGVWVRGLTWLTNLGSTPSIDIATATRVHPTITLKTTWMALSMIPMIMRNKRIGLSVSMMARELNHGGIAGAGIAGVYAPAAQPAADSQLWSTVRTATGPSTPSLIIL